ncbi:tRNA-hydroxylase [Pseudomonas putida S11]|nr:tRNA-hydroxylase [Pseudomonas putida S11]
MPDTRRLDRKRRSPTRKPLLIDHKNCEFKAASTALSLIAKYNTHLDLINMMSRLAREELVHHEQVLRLMKRRGVPLRPVSAGRYAVGACGGWCAPTSRSSWWIRWWWGRSIEARSCERFAALVPHLDEELGRFYHGLLKSEARHYQGYLKLAHNYGEEADIARRVDLVRAAEVELIQSPDQELRFHSGIPMVQAA